MSQIKKILVTGGAGYIGCHAVWQLIREGYEVVVLDDLSTGVATNVSCPLIIGDIGDAKLLDKIFTDHKIDLVMHFAASIVVGESVFFPEKYFENNVSKPLVLLAAMLKYNVKNFIFSSSCAVYGEPTYVPIDESHPKLPMNPYGESKLILEKILKWYVNAHNFSAVIFRYFNAAGYNPEIVPHYAHKGTETLLLPNTLRVAKREQEFLQVFGKDYPTPDGTAIRDYIHVSDIAAAHVLGAKKLEKDSGCHTYNIGTEKGMSVCQIVDTAMEITGKMIPIEVCPRRQGDPAVLIANCEKAKEELGFELKHSDIKNIISTSWSFYNKKEQEHIIPETEKTI